MMRMSRAMLRCVVAFAGALMAACCCAQIQDSITFGDAASEQAHQLVPTRSERVVGALNQPARQLLPLEPAGIDGGKVAFVLKVDPQRPNYFTIKLWGSDCGEESRLLLFCQGKQVGARHIGDVDCLDIMAAAPRFAGRFFYTTTILPKAMTQGKTSVNVEIRSLGRIWGYGDTWEKFQKKLEKPTRGIYRAYSHTDACFMPSSDEVQGKAITDVPVRQTPGPEVLDQLKTRVNDTLKSILVGRDANQMQMEFLARAYHVKWTLAYENPAVVRRLLQAMDTLYIEYKANPKLAQSDPKTYNPDWFGFGPAGDAVGLLGEQIKPELDTPIAAAGGITRREAYAEMLLAAREWNRQHRRQYTNQSMIKDLFGIYLANRGLQVIAPEKAMPENDARRYLYESVGLQPWLGNDKPEGGSEMPLGDDYMQLTRKGLTRELGYVGAYGEVLDWVNAIYNATRATPAADGDPKIRQQLVRIAQARASFRYPLIDADGFRAMSLETVVGWRDSHYPGDITYGQRATWDSGPLETAAATMDATLIGYAQQMLEDNQLFASLQERMENKGFRVTGGLLFTPDAYETIRSQPRSAGRLPMTSGEKDFVFSDEEDGVVAIKHGQDILYASLYWRARYAVNFLARVHYLTPTIERDSTVWEDVEYEDSGMKYLRDGRVIEQHSGRHERSRGDVRQALEGEVLPIAKVPEGLGFRPGQESVYAGKGSFYTLRYGPYLMAMNCSAEKTVEVKRPEGVEGAMELVSGKDVSFARPLRIAPRSTLVFFLGAK